MSLLKITVLLKTEFRKFDRNNSDKIRAATFFETKIRNRQTSTKFRRKILEKNFWIIFWLLLFTTPTR